MFWEEQNGKKGKKGQNCGKVFAAIMSVTLVFSNLGLAMPGNVAFAETGENAVEAENAEENSQAAEEAKEDSKESEAAEGKEAAGPTDEESKTGEKRLRHLRLRKKSIQIRRMRVKLLM